MVAFRGHFDGRVIVPEEAVDLPRSQQLLVRVEPAEPRGVNGSDLLRFAGTIADEDAKEMMQIIEAECERISDDW